MNRKSKIAADLYADSVVDFTYKFYTQTSPLRISRKYKNYCFLFFTQTKYFVTEIFLSTNVHTNIFKYATTGEMSKYVY